jgi:hypothetical protein
VTGNTLLIADQDGTIRTIDPATATETKRESFAGRIPSWGVYGADLVIADGSNDKVVRELPRAPKLPPDDPILIPRVESKPADREWTLQGSEKRISPPLRVGNRVVRTTRGGGTREVVNGKTVEYEGQFPILVEWGFACVGTQVYAIGDGGVYTVDDKLRPTNVFISVPTNEQAPTPVLRLAGAPQNLCISVGGNAASLQIWSKDGKQMIRSTSVAQHSHSYHSSSPARLLRLGQGYLLTTDELVYLPDDPAKPVWRFSMNIGSSGRVPGTEAFWQADGFSIPRIVGNRLVVCGRIGGIYIFDLKAIGAM